MTFDLGPALLFCPADRPDRFEKALERADAVIIDLEDAVAPDDREDAREALVQTALDPAQGHRAGQPGGQPRLRRRPRRRSQATAYRYVMLPKAEHPDAGQPLSRATA